MEKKYIRGKKDTGVSTPVDADYTMLVEDVVRRFAETGVRRSPRMIGRYCSEGQLICDYRSDDRRWHINPDSVEERIKILEKAQKEAQRAVTGKSSESSTETVNEDHKVSVGESERKIPELEEENKKLKRKIRDLEITNGAKDEALDIIKGQAQFMVEEIGKLNYQLGEAEAKLKQLKAGISDTTKIIDAKDVETGNAGDPELTNGPSAQTGEAETNNNPTAKTESAPLEDEILMDKETD